MWLSPLNWETYFSCSVRSFETLIFLYIQQSTSELKRYWMNNLKDWWRIWRYFVFSLCTMLLWPYCPQKSVGKISFTMDIWSDPNHTPFMAVTAHWIESVSDGLKTTLKLRADLIGFQRVPGHHDGEHLAQAFLFITDHLNITNNVSEFLFEDDHSEWPEIIRSSALMKLFCRSGG